jgi:hypothetical protein
LVAPASRQLFHGFLQGVGAKIADCVSTAHDNEESEAAGEEEEEPPYSLPPSIAFYCELYCAVLHCPANEMAVRGKKREDRLKRVLGSFSSEVFTVPEEGLSIEPASAAVSAAQC